MTNGLSGPYHYCRPSYIIVEILTVIGFPLVRNGSSGLNINIFRFPICKRDENSLDL